MTGTLPGVLAVGLLLAARPDGVAGQALPPIKAERPGFTSARAVVGAGARWRARP